MPLCMVSITAAKNGKTFEIDGEPYVVVKYFHQKLGRGGANVTLKMRNLKTGALFEKTFSSNAKLEEIQTQKKPLQYLYNDGTSAVFMNPSTYEQVEIPLAVVEDELPYLKEGEAVDVLFWEGKPLSVSIAPKVVLQVSQTDPGVKGDSASNVYKSATLENGLQVKVPLFIKTGDRVRIDTRTGEYEERVTN